VAFEIQFQEIEMNEEHRTGGSLPRDKKMLYESGDFVCSFCGGDHGAADCEKALCPDCFKASCGHTCSEMISAVDALCEIVEIAWDTACHSGRDYSSLDTFGSHMPVELAAHVAATFPLSPANAFLEDLFPPNPPDDGRVWNRSSRFGSCYQMAFEAMLHEEEKYQRVAGSNEEVLLVHGYIQVSAEHGYMGHAWLETGNVVIDFGQRANEFRQVDRDRYYADYSVIHPTQYSKPETARNSIESGHCGPWAATPDDIPMEERP